LEREASSLQVALLLKTFHLTVSQGATLVVYSDNYPIINYDKMSKYLITTDGGLGNEIISYALWLHLREKGKRPLLFLRRNLLGQVFPKTYTTARWPFLFYNYIKFHKKLLYCV